jgi:hypothetical protein
MMPASRSGCRRPVCSTIAQPCEKSRQHDALRRDAAGALARNQRLDRRADRGCPLRPRALARSVPMMSYQAGIT